MRSRRIAVIGFAVLLAAFAASIALPGIVRRVAIAQLGAVTGRPAAIDAVELDVWRGRLVAHGIHLAERDGSPFADLERLEVRLSLLALLRGQVWIRDLGLHRLVVRLVRRPTGELNLLDLIDREGGRGRPIDLAIDRFSLHAGQISLEDRALPGAPTWTSEDIVVEASNVSTRSADGRASASSMTGGARVSVNVTRLRLHPIELEATVTTDGMDLAPMSVYLPPGAPVVVDRGRARTEIWLALDARGGLRVDVSGHLVDLALVRTAEREVVAVAPDLRVDARGVSLRDGAVHLGRVELSGTVGVADPRFRSGAMQMSTVRAGAWDLSWPPTTDGRVDVRASLAPSGSLTVAGTVRPPPAPSQLHARLVDLDVAPWASVLSLPASVAGIAAADLRLDEPLAAEVPARVHGSIAVDRLAVSDAGRELVHVRRVEASGLEVGWPARIAVGACRSPVPGLLSSETGPAPFRCAP